MTVYPETKLKGQIRDWLKKFTDIKSIPYPAGIGGEPGTPDRIGCMRMEITPSMVGKTVGVMFLVEVKRPLVEQNGKVLQTAGAVTPLQTQRIEEWRRCGAHATVVSSMLELHQFIAGVIDEYKK